MQWNAGSTRHCGWAAGLRSFRLDVTLLGFFLEVSQTIYSFRINHHSGFLPLLYRSLLVSLLCHWLVCRAGRRGLLNVIPFAGVLKRAILLVDLDREGGSETVLCCDGKWWLV